MPSIRFIHCMIWMPLHSNLYDSLPELNILIYVLMYFVCERRITHVTCIGPPQYVFSYVWLNFIFPRHTRHMCMVCPLSACIHPLKSVDWKRHHTRHIYIAYRRYAPPSVWRSCHIHHIYMNFSCMCRSMCDLIASKSHFTHSFCFWESNVIRQSCLYLQPHYQNQYWL